jgi:hypothetical protein
MDSKTPSWFQKNWLKIGMSMKQTGLRNSRLTASGPVCVETAKAQFAAKYTSRNGERTVLFA